ncbi:MAG: hypothetical protein IIB55_03725 [Planctomycetes bacterium]|nr:hypothetical protein [Planctomycetota bacterium]
MVRRTGTCIARTAVLLAIAAWAGGCEEYSQDSAQAVVQSARQMVAEGRADRLPTLIYAESKRERRVLREVGSLLGHVQDLAVAVNEAFPAEVAALRARAEAAAKDGRASSTIAGWFTGRSTGNRAGNRAGNPQQVLSDVFAGIMADPFGWLEQNETRLGTEYVAQDTEALTWDGRAILPPLGVLLKRQEGKWYVLLPTHMPAVQRMMPDNEEFWAALPELVHVVDNMIVDLTRDVRERKVRDLEALSEQAGKRAFVPMMIAAYALGKSAQAEEDARPAPRGAPASDDGGP